MVREYYSVIQVYIKICINVNSVSTKKLKMSPGEGKVSTLHCGSSGGSNDFHGL